MMQQEETMKIIFHVVTADGPNWRTPAGASEWMWRAWDSSEGAPKEVVLKFRFASKELALSFQGAFETVCPVC